MRRGLRLRPGPAAERRGAAGGGQPPPGSSSGCPGSAGLLPARPGARSPGKHMGGRRRAGGTTGTAGERDEEVTAPG